MKGMQLRLVRDALLLLTVVLAIPVLSYAHQDYERLIMRTYDDKGRKIEVFKHYTEGVAPPDPVKIVIYSNEQNIIFQSGYSRDLNALRYGRDGLLLFQSDNPLNPFQVTAWQFKDYEISPYDSFSLYYLAVIANLKDHWLGYLVMVFLSLYFLKKFRRSVLEVGQKKRVIVNILGIILFGFLFLVILMAAFVAGRLSSAIIIGLVGLFTFAGYLLKKRKGEQ